MIADYLMKLDYDIIILNEAFDNDMNDTFREILKIAYPYYIYEMGSHLGPNEDSGLMVFSRFAPLENKLLSALPCDPVSTNCGSNAMDTWSCDNTIIDDGTFPKCSKAFHAFSDLASDDTFAVKGVGWIRVWNPRTNAPLNVFFSHTQADYLPGKDYSSVRALNLIEIRQFMYKVVPSMKEDMMLASDLNIPGDVSHEYEMQITLPSMNFKKMGFMDAFREDGAPTDPGYTWSHLNNQTFSADDKEYRLDFFFNKIARNCNQQVMTRRDFVAFASFNGIDYASKGLQGVDLSDHYALDDTFAPIAQHCSPSRAMVDPTEGLKPMKIENGGNYQWIHYTKPGTFTFDVGTPNASTAFEIVAYSEKDLSTPLAVWEGSSVIGKGNIKDREGNYVKNSTVTYSPTGPFYLRIRPVSDSNAHNKNWIGDYTLNVHENLGASWDDAIAIHPEQTELTNTMVKGTATAHPQTEFYYSMKTERLFSGKQQKFSFDLSQKVISAFSEYIVPPNNTPIASFGLSLKSSKSGPDLLSAVQKPVDANRNWNYSTSTDVPADQANYRLIVTRPIPIQNEEAPFSIKYKTNLHTIDLLFLHNSIQEDELGDDEPYLLLTIDGIDRTLLYGEMDTKQSKSNPDGFFNSTPFNVHHINIADKISLNLFEMDGDDSPDFFDQTVTYPDEHMGKTGQIDSKHIGTEVKGVYFNDAPIDGYASDYSYSLYYRMTATP